MTTQTRGGVPFDPCATHSVSSWEGDGPHWNQQTGSHATATFYDQSGNLPMSAPISANAIEELVRQWDERQRA
ncbi:hypothetical protein C8250_041210 [Streptomyces sp. So13.3]|uniref:hypothetical protein n=1 Tax=unclassified Streptomyces TaxID=2593676 RepID=UPI001105AE60|nr:MULTISPECIES: hypothetical protein [unclassified Streptomyces]MCZ4098466.1 hypothetical protein [Streptomyces sp. H39-C1]QNA77381.1 hypothetical protein C8250_041210 [Streptomyces sp. So13.3]